MTKATAQNEEVLIPYGKRQAALSLADYQLLSTGDLPPVPDLVQAIKEALAHPVGSPTIKENVKKSDRVVIVVNDITRPLPSDLLVREIAAELNEAGVRDEQIMLLVATGTHRANTGEELVSMLGQEVLGRFAVVNHDSKDQENLVRVGETPGGLPVVVNRLYIEADYRILTGAIVPHHAAGFSGGRKSVIPGLAGNEMLAEHHSLKFRPFNPALGVLENNQFHLEAVAGAQLAGAEFIVNVVPNSKGEIVSVVAGDMEAAHLQGVKTCLDMCRCTLSEPADIVIAGPGGYPRDINLYQAQKAVSVAETVVRDGGTIILVAECEKGIGHPTFSQWMSEAGTPEEVIRRFREVGFIPGANKAFMFARALSRCRVIVVSDRLDDEQLAAMFMERADTIDQALKLAGPLTDDTKVAVIPRAVHIIPQL